MDKSKNQSKINKEIVAVVGATGTIGRPLVSELLTEKRSVRAVSREPEEASLSKDIEVVYGDLNKPETLKTAFAGATQLVLFADPYTIDAAVKAAKNAGIEHIVLVSSAAVTAGYDTTWNYVAEQTVKNSGIAWTIVRPGEFMMNALQIWGPSIRSEQKAVEPFPDQVGTPIHERDVAEVVAMDIIDKTRRGRIDTIVGPEEISKREQIEAIAKGIGKKIKIDVVSPAEARDFYKKQGGFAADNADFLFGFESYDGVEGEHDEPQDVEVDAADSEYKSIAEVIGKPARSFAEWVADHREDFTPL